VPARLSVQLPDAPAIVRVLDDATELVLGRAADCDLVVDHASVSRRHARLARQGEAWRLADLGSKNGIRVDGRRVEEETLRSGQWFSLGDVFCRFDVVDATELDAAQARADVRRMTSRAWQERIAASSASGPDAMLAELIRAIVQLADCRRGFLLTGNPIQGLAVRACYAMSPDDLAGTTFSGSAGAVERCLRQRRPVFLTDPADQAWLKGRASVIAHGIRALVALPLEHDGRLLGVAYADSDEAGKLFTELDAEILHAFAAQAGVLLSAAGLERALREVERWLVVGDDGVAAGEGRAPAWSALQPQDTTR
jgi:GAF domain-containing protein